MKNDLISRQLLIKKLCERRCGDKPKGCPAGFCTVSLEIDCIPSAEPDSDRYEQGIIEGRVQMRTELLTKLKEMVGEEIWMTI